ncbi:MAG TPA: hypothetical protein VF777_11445 [Phycisphaerales bacterium]
MERRIEPKQGAAPARALVCHAPGSAPPSMLLQALERRGFSVEIVPGTHRVLARAVVVRHDPETCHLRLVVVLVEPAKLSRPSECLDALRTMPGGVACWVFDASNGELRAASAVDLDRWSEKNAVSARSAGSPLASQNNGPAAAYESVARSVPALRFTGDWPETAQATAHGMGQQGGQHTGDDSDLARAVDQSQTPPALLTDEELDMLLGDDTGAGPDRGSGTTGR